MTRDNYLRLNVFARLSAALVLLVGLLGVAPARPVVAASGDLDTTFDTDGQTTVDFATNRADHAQLTYLQADGKLLVAGTSYSGAVGDFAITRLNTNGSVDTTFGASGYQRVDFFGDSDELSALAVDSNGNIVLVGKAQNTTPDSDVAVARLTPNGALDTTFDTDGKATFDGGAGNDSAAAVAFQADGKIVVAGSIGNFGAVDFLVARFTPTGTVDVDFGLGGYNLLDLSGGDDAATHIALQPTDGIIVLAGTANTTGAGDFAVARLNTDGSFDFGFGDDDGVGGQLGYAVIDMDAGADVLKALALQSDGKIIVAGQATQLADASFDFGVARLTTTGVLDTGFSGDGKALVALSGEDVFTTLTLQTDGKVLLGGTTGTVNPDDFALARLTPAGTLDTFGTGGKAILDFGSSIDMLTAVALQSDGKIVMAGTVDDGFFPQFGIARLTPAGALDTTLGGGAGYALSTLGTAVPGETVALTILPDERMVVVGTTTTGNSDFAVARFMGDTDFLSGLAVGSSSPTVLNAATVFTATLTAGNKETRAWNFGDGTTVVTTTAGVTTTNHTYASPGTYTVLITATNSLNSLTGTLTANVDSVLGGLSAANSGPTALGSATAFTPTLGAGSRPAYVWNFGDGVTSTLTSPSYTYGSVGVYSVVVTATNSVSTITATTTVTVDQAIGTLTATNSSPTVLTNQTFFTAAVTAGSNVSYQWNWGDGTALGSGLNANHTYTATGTYTAIVTATNSVSTKSVTTTVNVDTVLSGLTATNSGPTVQGNTTLFTSTVSGSRPVFTWDFGDGQTGSGANPSHTYAAFGTYTAVVTATNSVGYITQTTTVNVDVGVTGLAATNSGPTALGSATAFTATASTGSRLTYSWNWGDGTALGSGANPTHTYADFGTYTVIVTATNSVSTQSANTTVNVDQSITGLAAQNSGPTLLTYPTFLSATLGTGSRVSYAWNFGDGQTGNGANATHTYGALGTYTAVVTATNTVDVVTQTTSVTVTDIPISGLAASNDSPTTVFSPTLFTASIITGTTVVYQWNFGDGQAGSGSAPSHVYTTVGAYTAVLTATNSAGGPVTTTTAVTITDIPVTGLAAQNSGPTVLGNTTFFTSTIVTGTNVVYTWNFGDGETGSGATISHTYAVGTYTAIVTATNGTSQPSVTTTVNVDVPASGLAASNNSPTPSGSAVGLSATVSAGSRLTYAWDFGDGTTGTGANPTHAYGPIGVYTAVVTATNSVSVLTATTNITITEVPLSGITASNSGPTTIGHATTFTASVSAGSNPTFMWDFSDGQVGAGAHPTHTYAALGVYTAVVTATNSVNVITTTTTITVEPYRIFMPLVTRVSAAPVQIEPTSALPLEPQTHHLPARRR